MSKVPKNSINPNHIDFLSTALDCASSQGIQLTDTVEFYYTTGELAASVTVQRIVEFLEENNLHVPEDKYPHECNALEYFDNEFEEATTLYFMDRLAIRKELDYAA